jgi:hypothetical protein
LGKPAPGKTSAAGPLSSFFAFYILVGFIVMSQDVSEDVVVCTSEGVLVSMSRLFHYSTFEQDRFIERK